MPMLPSLFVWDKHDMLQLGWQKWPVSEDTLTSFVVMAKKTAFDLKAGTSLYNKLRVGIEVMWYSSSPCVKTSAFYSFTLAEEKCRVSLAGLIYATSRFPLEVP